MDGLIAYALSKKYVDGKTSGLATGMSWKGTKENISNLPQSGNQIGDLWHVNEDGNEYAWDGSKWEALGGIGSPITVDSALSSTSENPVQNKVIKAALDEKGTYSKPAGGIPASDLADGVIPTGAGGLTGSQIASIAGLLQLAVYAEDPSGAFDAFLAAFPIYQDGSALTIIGGVTASLSDTTLTLS